MGCGCVFSFVSSSDPKLQTGKIMQAIKDGFRQSLKILGCKCFYRQVVYPLIDLLHYDSLVQIYMFNGFFIFFSNLMLTSCPLTLVTDKHSASDVHCTLNVAAFLGL